LANRIVAPRGKEEEGGPNSAYGELSLAHFSRISTIKYCISLPTNAPSLLELTGLNPENPTYVLDSISNLKPGLI
jgi:hypothetical protein